MRWLLSAATCFAFVLQMGIGLGKAEEADGSKRGDARLPKRSEVLKGLRPEHPRIFARADDFKALAERCRTEPRLGRWRMTLFSDAEKLLTRPPVEYEIPDGKRLLAVSRAAKERLLLLGMAYQLSGEQRFADRAWRELETVIGFQDWNPSHFLDTAEMTFAVAIGYDWLYDRWSPEQRQALRAAIVRLGFEPGLRVYRKDQGWSKAIHNWNQVCNGGLGVGALAIGEDEPEVASEILHGALRSLPRAMKEFAPDGGWGEGPGYWGYATEYNVYFLAAMNTALGTDDGLSDSPGFSVTGHFPIHFVGPTGRAFNFADAHERWHGAPQLFWLATRFSDPAQARAQLPYADSNPTPLDLLWGAAWAAEGPSKSDSRPLMRYFQGVSVVAARGDWNDPHAMYVAFKGGSNRVNHGHLDLGTFVLDALGERWAIDLGADDYNLPGYFGAQRWTYLRNNTHGHNAVLINDEDQDPAGTAKVVRSFDGEQGLGAIVDLSSAWPRTQRVWRGIALLDRSRVLVQDEVDAVDDLRAAWQMLTSANVRINGRTAVLEQAGKRLSATLLLPADGVWTSAPVAVPSPQRPIKNVHKLVASSPQSGKQARFAVLFHATEDSRAAPEIVDLKSWPPASGK